MINFASLWRYLVEAYFGGPTIVIQVDCVSNQTLEISFSGVGWVSFQSFWLASMSKFVRP